MNYAKDREALIEALVNLSAKYSDVLMRITVLEHRSVVTRLRDWFRRGPTTVA